MLDKRTPRSQNFKNYQLQQQHPQSFSKCDALPQPFFDFALADPLPANIYELLKATILYLDAVQSPICSTVRQALLQFEQYAAISSITLASVVSCSIKYQLESQGSLTSTKLPTAASADIFKLDTSSTLQLPSVSSSSTINDDISSLLDISASQLESQCLLFEQQISLCEQFHSIKENFSICEAYNLRLDTELTRLQADNLQLCKRIPSTHDQERAALIYSAVTAQFRRSYQSKRHFSSGASVCSSGCLFPFNTLGPTPPSDP
jgi:hypothetical protein